MSKLSKIKRYVFRDVMLLNKNWAFQINNISIIILDKVQTDLLFKNTINKQTRIATEKRKINSHL